MSEPDSTDASSRGVWSAMQLWLLQHCCSFITAVNQSFVFFFIYFSVSPLFSVSLFSLRRCVGQIEALDATVIASSASIKRKEMFDLKSVLAAKYVRDAQLGLVFLQAAKADLTFLLE